MTQLARATDEKAILPIDRLERLARTDGLPVSGVSNLLWLVASHFKLRGAAQVWRHLSDVLLLIPGAMQTSLKELGIEDWVPSLTWLLSDPATLAQAIFAGEDLKARKERALFLQSTPPNPTLRDGMRTSGLYSCLWCSHPVQRLQRAFRVLQAHMLVAHIAIMRVHFSFDNWKQRTPPDPKFFAWLYLPALQLRHFSEPHGEWDSILRDAALSLLPISCPREESPKRIRAVARSISQAEECFKDELLAEAEANDSARTSSEKPDDESQGRSEVVDVPDHEAIALKHHRVSEGLRKIAKFLEWGLNPTPRDNRTGHGCGGNRKGGSKSIGGAGDSYVLPAQEETDTSQEAEPLESAEPKAEEDDGTERGGSSGEVLLGDEDDPDDPPIALHVLCRANEDPELRAALIAAGDHPDELLNGPAIIFASDRAGVSFANSGAVERAHQLLSDSYDDLSFVELAHLFLDLKSASEKDPELLEVYALVSVCVWTGASLKQGIALLILKDEFPHQECDLEECDLALRLDGLGAWWRIRALPIAIQSRPSGEIVQRTERYFELPDAVGASRAVRSYLEHLRSAPDASANPDEKPVRIFGRDEGWYRQRLRDLVKDRNSRITWGKLSRVMFQQIIDHTGGDKVLAAIITRNDHHLAKVGRHYATPRVRTLQELYFDCAAALREELFLAGYDLDPCPVGELAPPDIAVGSPLCPTLSTFREMVRTLKAIVTGSTGWSSTRHNAFVSYIVEMFAVCAAMRAVSDPLAVLDDVDVMSGYSFIADKGLQNWRKAAYSPA